MPGNPVFGAQQVRAVQDSQPHQSSTDLFWPQGEPGLLRQAARDWRQMARQLEAVRNDCRMVVKSVLAENQGKPFDAFGAYWQRWEGFFGEAVRGCNALAAALEQDATAIDDARHKIEIIAAAAAVVIATGIVLTVFTLGASDAAAAAAAGGMALEAAAVETTLMSVVTSIAVDAGIGALEGAVLDAALQAVRIEVFQDQRTFNWAEVCESAGIGLVGGAVGGGLAAGGGRIASRLLPGTPPFVRSGLGGMAVGGGTAAITDEITTGRVNPWDVVEGTVIGGVAGGTAGAVQGRPPTRSITPELARAQIIGPGTGKASEVVTWAESQGWTRTQTPGGPITYVDDNGVVRVTIKKGSPRTPGSESAHVELRDANGQRIDPFGAPVARRSAANHTPIVWDLP